MPFGLPVYNAAAARLDHEQSAQNGGMVRVVGLYTDEEGGNVTHYLVRRTDVAVSDGLLVKDLEDLSGMDTDNTHGTVFVRWHETQWHISTGRICDTLPPDDKVKAHGGKTVYIAYCPK